MTCLIVTAHPLRDSLCASLALEIRQRLEARGHAVVFTDLYADGFSPALSPMERQTYYNGPYDHSAVKGQVAQLMAAENLILVFPTWWFSLPAMLKGWFDRVWGPGIAYDHADDYGPIRPRLDHLQNMLAMTTLGAPWWVDWLVLRRPVQKVLKKAILGACAPQCRFTLLSLYNCERIDAAKYRRFCHRMGRTLDGWSAAS